MYNQQDSDERCYSDSLAELPEHNEIDGKRVRALNLDLIKRRLDRGLYKRLDEFQRDIFSVLERARNLSRTDSQVRLFILWRARSASYSLSRNCWSLPMVIDSQKILLVTKLNFFHF